MKWFRLYHDVIDDPKIGLLPESEQLLWFKLLCLASMSDDRGSIEMNDDELCFRLRISVEFWRCVKEKFRVKGLIECGKNGSIKICNWDKRQYDSDSSTERTKRYRSKQKSLKEKTGNVTGTSQERPCDALDTDTEEIRQESETEKSNDPDGDRAFEISEDLATKSESVATVSPNAVAQKARAGTENPTATRVVSSAQRVEDRFKAGAKPIARFWMPLIEQQLEHLWTGPGRNDFNEDLVRGAQAHLKKHEKPCDRGDALQYIRNGVTYGRFADLEARFEEGGGKFKQVEVDKKIHWTEMPEYAEAWRDYVAAATARGSRLECETGSAGSHLRRFYNLIKADGSVYRSQFDPISARSIIKVWREQDAARVSA